MIPRRGIHEAWLAQDGIYTFPGINGQMTRQAHLEHSIDSYERKFVLEFFEEAKYKQI